MGSLSRFHENDHHVFAFAPRPSQRNGPPTLRHESSSHGSRMPREDSGMGSMSDNNFDILEWHPKYLSCQRYFLDHAQYEPATQAVCALINIRLPFQWLGNPVNSSSQSQQQSGASSTFNFNTFARGSSSAYNSPQRNGNENQANFASPIPYIRRLIVTGFDKAAVLHGFFGDDYVKGVMPHVECERRNYLFAAKAGGWSCCKKQYDMGSGGGGDETLPFMKPLDEAKMEELVAAEKAWSSWLAMEDWMVGPRAPNDEDGLPSGRGGGHRGGGINMRDNLPDGVSDAFEGSLRDGT